MVACINFVSGAALQGYSAVTSGKLSVRQWHGTPEIRHRLLAVRIALTCNGRPEIGE